MHDVHVELVSGSVWLGLNLLNKGSAVAWWLMPRTPDPEVVVRAPLRSNRVVSLSKAYLLPKSTGNAQEAVAPSQHD